MGEGDVRMWNHQTQQKGTAQDPHGQETQGTGKPWGHYFFKVRQHAADVLEGQEDRHRPYIYLHSLF